MRKWLVAKHFSRFDTLALMVYAALLAQHRFWTACGFLAVALIVTTALEWNTPARPRGDGEV